MLNQQAKPSNNEEKEEDKLRGAQAPGKPTENDGYIPTKNWDGKKVRNPHGGGYGWPNEKKHVWIPSGPKGRGGPHWDVQDPKTEGGRNVFPGGKER